MLERAWLTGVASKRVSEEWGVLEGYRNIGYMECGGHGGGLRGGGAEVSFGCLINYAQYGESGTVRVGRYQNSGTSNGTLDIKIQSHVGH